MALIIGLDRYFFLLGVGVVGTGARWVVHDERRWKGHVQKKGTRTWVEAATARREAHKTVFIGTAD